MLCSVFAFSTAFAQNAQKNTKETVTFNVKNMSCDNCVKKIEKNIAFEKGVTDLQCELKTKSVKVTYNTDKTDAKKLVAAFKKIGYDVEPKEDTPKKVAF
jgi:Cu2+-exporting ATPase